MAITPPDYHRDKIANTGNVLDTTSTLKIITLIQIPMIDIALVRSIEPINN
jgi:hypothetical protein